MIMTDAYKFGSKWFQLQFAFKRTCTPPKIKEFSSRSILYRWTIAYTRTHANQPDSLFFKTEKWKKKMFHSVDKHQIKFFFSYRSRKKNRWYRCVNPLFKGVQRGYKSISQVYTCRSWKQSNWFIAYQRKATSHLFGKVLILTDFGNTSMFITFNSLSSFQWLYLISFVT